MGKNATGIILIMGAVGVLYLAASGNLDSAWRGIRGQCGVPEQAEEMQGGHAQRGNYYGTPIGQLYVSDAGVY